MNQRELNELRRRFKPDRTAISKVYGCYVSSSRQIISYVDAPLGLLSQEEQEMYLNLLKKSLSGALGRNLIDIEFSTRQVADSDEHRLLQTLRQTELQDPNARESLYRRIIDAIDMGESSYLILLAADTYDVPHRSRDGHGVPVFRVRHLPGEGSHPGFAVQRPGQGVPGQLHRTHCPAPGPGVPVPGL